MNLFVVHTMISGDSIKVVRANTPEEAKAVAESNPGSFGHCDVIELAEGREPAVLWEGYFDHEG